MFALIVANEPILLKSLDRVLKARGIVCLGTTSAGAAMKVLEHNPDKFDFILSDFGLTTIEGKGPRGVDIYEAAHRLAVPCLLMSATCPPAYEDVWLEKPFSVLHLFEMLRGMAPLGGFEELLRESSEIVGDPPEVTLEIGNMPIVYCDAGDVDPSKLK